MIVTGTDTDVGKTVVASMLALGLGLRYFKPLQCGCRPQTDVQAVQRMTGLGADKVLETPVILTQPLSPHRSAELDGVSIDLESLTPPLGRCIVEGAGGLMVPVNRNTLFIDLFAKWKRPVILVARTGLGTINHTLMSLEALHSRKIDVLGIVFVGDENLDTQTTLSEMGRTKVLGRVPMLDKLEAENLNQVFKRNFTREDFGTLS
ncbi:MAG: dethiobiotin synthase [Magnetovibrio sp.]|nr:dethiobiotin synthase [Magnetovibrio sp.]